MEDREIVAAVAAGDPAGLAGAYDTYAETLYGYCHWMLAEPGDAAQAVQDTFVLAAGRLGQLRDPGKVRSWLFSTARGECLRRAGAGAGEELEGAGAAGDGTGAAEGDQAADARREAERAELRRLIRTTLAGLAAREREAVELSLWHDLDDTDLAAVLGVSRPRAYALASDGRRQLEKTLGVVRTARTGREACRELGLWLEDWDGQLNAATLELVSRHSEHCEICGRRQGGTLRPAALGRLLPLPALPPGLREQVLERCAAAAGAAGAAAPGAAQETAGGGSPARAFSQAGALLAGWDRIRRNPRAMAAMVVVLVAVAISVPLIAVGGAHAVRNLVAQSNGGGAGDPGAAGGARGQASASAGSGASRSPQPGAVAPVTFLKPSAGSSRNVTPSKSPRPKPPGSPQASGSASASSSASSSTTPAIGPTPSRVASSAGTSPSPSPTPTPTPSPSPSPAPTSS